MNLKTFAVCVAVGCAVVGTGTVATGGQDGAAGESQQAQAEAYMKASQPGERHEALQPLIGTWTIKTTMWMDPANPPMEATGEVTKSWSLGERFVREEITMESPMGGPMKGVGFLGFDNGLKKYQGVWMSDSSTGMILYSGEADAAGKVLTFTGKESDPMGGPPLEFRSVLRIEGPDKHILTFMYLLPGGVEHKAFEMVHTRKK